MKILQFLLSVTATFVGVIYAFTKFDLYVSFDVEPYYFLLLALGVATLFMFPYHWANKEEEIIKIDGIKVHRKIIHQLIEEEMKKYKNLDIHKTEVQISKKGIVINPQLTIEKVTEVSILQQTKELLEDLDARMKQVFGETLHYQFNITYKTK